MNTMTKPDQHSHHNVVRLLIAATVLCVITASNALAQAATDSPPFPILLVQGTAKPNNNKPARLFYESDHGDTTQSIDAALMSNGYSIAPLSIAGTVESEVLFKGAWSRKSLVEKPTDNRSLKASLDQTWQLNNSSLLTSVGLSIEDDHIHRAYGHMEQFDVQWVRHPITAKRKVDIGDAAAIFKYYPFGGLYRRAVNSTDDATAKPVGTVGGPYAGVLIHFALGKVMNDGGVFERVSLDTTLQYVRDSSVSSNYQTGNYRFADITLSFPLSKGKDSNFSPAIALTRTVGTDRLANELKKATTSLALTIGYGI